MARMPRLVVPGQALHIIQRGNNRQAVFNADEDYRFYLDALEQAANCYRCAIHAYVLMTNHVHLLLTPSTTEGPSKLMQSVGRRYVRYINNLYQRTGTLWEGRYKSALIDSNRYFLTCSRYIELNPVRAVMVEQPDKYSWSSYHFNGSGQANGLLTPHQLYESLGSTPESRQNAYRALFVSNIEENDLRVVRQGTEREGVIGDQRFRSEIETILQRRVRKFTHGGDRKSEKFRSAKA